MKRKLSKIETDLTEGLEGLLHDLKASESIGKKYRRAAPEMHPRKYRPKRAVSRRAPRGRGGKAIRR